MSLFPDSEESANRAFNQEYEYVFECAFKEEVGWYIGRDLEKQFPGLKVVKVLVSPLISFEIGEPGQKNNRTTISVPEAAEVIYDVNDNDVIRYDCGEKVALFLRAVYR